MNEALTQAPAISTPNATPAIVLRPGEGEAVWFLDHFITVKADAAKGAPFSLSEIAFPAGAHTPFHRHQGESESFYVLEGEVTFVLEDGRKHTGGAGTFLHVPAGVAHGFQTDSFTRMIVITGQVGFLDLARDAGGPAERREIPPPAAPDLAKLDAAAARHGIDLLGPLPE
ncbi:MAG: cupin domain-containing protein [Sandaracinaceae bacterium]|nr:cupin domain-containing protein [Sandaracinaceae bacterium]